MYMDPHVAAVVHQSRVTEMQEAAERARMVSRLAARTRSKTLWDKPIDLCRQSDSTSAEQRNTARSATVRDVARMVHVSR